VCFFFEKAFSQQKIDRYIFTPGEEKQEVTIKELSVLGHWVCGQCLAWWLFAMQF
jgi:hypothetical protein